jgi:general secretion pathway protein C
MVSTITQTLKEKFKRLQNLPSALMRNGDFLKSLFILAVITVLSFEMTDLFYKIISLPLIKKEIAPMPVQLAHATAAAQDKKSSDYAVITERNLFKSTLKAVSLNQEGLFSEQDKADFDLKGTVAGPSSYSYAIIEERTNKKQKLLKPGDKIGSRELVKIARNEATFREGGREIKMKVKETIEGPLLSPSASPAGRPRDLNMTLNPENIREGLNNLKALMNQAVIRPFLNQGNQEGFIISNIAPESIYAKMGLKNGDIIIDANNQPIHSAGSLLHLVNSLESGSKINLSIKREGKPQTINYSFN